MLSGTIEVLLDSTRCHVRGEVRGSLEAPNLCSRNKGQYREKQQST